LRTSKWAPDLERSFRNEIEKLGYKTKDKGNHYEIADVPEEVIALASTRRKQIEQMQKNNPGLNFIRAGREDRPMKKNWRFADIVRTFVGKVGPEPTESLLKLATKVKGEIPYEILELFESRANEEIQKNEFKEQQSENPPLGR